MKAKLAFAALAFCSFAGCAAVHRDAPTSKPAPATETVQITYHVIPGKEQELQRLLSAAWNVYRKNHLVFAQPHVVIRDKEADDKPRFVEIFTWVSSDAPDHAPAAVTTLWGQMQACCEARSGHQGLEGRTGYFGYTDIAGFGAMMSGNQQLNGGSFICLFAGVLTKADTAIMKVITACNLDFVPWLALAAEVEPLFGPMVHDSGFLTSLRKNIDRQTAFCVRGGDGSPGNLLLGGLLWSAHPPQYEIGWLAVAASHRRLGVGRILVDHVLAQVPSPATIGVTTFSLGLPGGESALHFYKQLGFVATFVEGSRPSSDATEA